MHISCKHCHSYNPENQLFCHHCRTPLWHQTVMAQKLLKKQEELEKKYLLEIQHLKEEILLLKHSLHQQEEKVAVPLEDTIKVDVNREKEAIIPIVFTTAVSSESKPELVQVVPPEPSYLSLQIQKWLEPLHEGLSLFSKVYDKYKQEGKLPIFFMTVAGILAILFGVGYLMQYSFQYLGIYEPVTKIGLGCIAAAGLIGLGIRITQKGERYTEYASALISLGIILNYLMIYFMSALGNFPILSSALLGFLLIIANTGSAIFLALKFETRVVSVLSLLGGATAPFYLNASGDGTLYYLYLWLLVIAANYVAYKIRWEALYYLSFITSFTMLEIVVFGVAPSNWIFILYYHMYAYLFFYLVFFNRLSLKKYLQKADILILSGNLSLLLLNLFTVHQDHLRLLGSLYLLNALIWGLAISKYWKQLTRHLRLVFFILIGSFVGFAVPALTDHVFIGLFWSIEAVLLILLGFLYRMPMVRKEGYIVLLIALLKLSYHSQMLIELWDVHIWHEGFLNYAVLGLVVASLWYIGQRYTKAFDQFEVFLYATFSEIVPLWLSSIFMLISYNLLGIWAVNLAVIPLFGLIFWSKKFNTQYTAIAGLAHMLILLAGVALSVQQVQSFHISNQALYAQIGLLELLGCCWFIQQYYQWLHIEESSSFKTAQLLRVIFFCLIPLVFVNFMRKHAIDFIEPGIWIASGITYLMHRKLRYEALLAEIYLLTLGALVVTFYTLEGEGFAAGIIICIAISGMEQSHKYDISNSSYSTWLIVAPYLIFLMIGTWCTIAVHQYILQGGVLFSLLTLVAILYKDKVAVINKSYKKGIVIAIIANFISLFAIAVDVSFISLGFSALSLIVFGLLLQNKCHWFNLEQERISWNTMFVFHQLQCLITYAMMLMHLDLDLSGSLISVVLVIHAIVLLFIALKTRIKIINQTSVVLFTLALSKVVLYDISEFEILPKIIVLIVLGALLLGASYTYVHLKKKYERR